MAAPARSCSYTALTSPVWQLVKQGNYYFAEFWHSEGVWQNVCRFDSKRRAKAYIKRQIKNSQANTGRHVIAQYHVPTAQTTYADLS